MTWHRESTIVSSRVIVQKSMVKRPVRGAMIDVPSAEPPATGPSSQPTGEGARILVIEDDPYSQDMLVRRLRSRGFQVEAASDGRAGLDLLARASAAHQMQPEGPGHAPPAGLPDIVLLGVNLPGLSGLEVLRSVRVSHNRAMIGTTMLPTYKAILTKDRVEWQDEAPSSEQPSSVIITFLDAVPSASRVTARRWRRRWPRSRRAAGCRHSATPALGSVNNGRNRPLPGRDE